MHTLRAMQRHVHRTGPQHRWVEIKAKPMSQSGHKRLGRPRNVRLYSESEQIAAPH